MRGRRGRRNLVKRGGVYYVEAIIKGRRIKRSLKTGVLEEAIERRESVLREERAALERGPEPEVPTFAEAARRALERMAARRAASFATWAICRSMP
jgi:hypothetical protein